MEKITFAMDGENAAEFYVLETTTISGFSYILVTDQEEGDADCWILKETENSEQEAVYEMIEDEQELDAVAAVFAQILDDETQLEY